MSRCKASEIPRNEAYYKYAAMTRDEGNAADGRFPTASILNCRTAEQGTAEYRSEEYFPIPLKNFC
jgi:hypothetical protein